MSIKTNKARKSAVVVLVRNTIAVWSDIAIKLVAQEATLPVKLVSTSSELTPFLLVTLFWLFSLLFLLPNKLVKLLNLQERRVRSPGSV